MGRAHLNTPYTVEKEKCLDALTGEAANSPIRKYHRYALPAEAERLAPAALEIFP